MNTDDSSILSSTLTCKEVGAPSDILVLVSDLPDMMVKISINLATISKTRDFMYTLLPDHRHADYLKRLTKLGFSNTDAFDPRKDECWTAHWDAVSFALDPTPSPSVEDAKECESSQEVSEKKAVQETRLVDAEKRSWIADALHRASTSGIIFKTLLEASVGTPTLNEFLAKSDYIQSHTIEEFFYYWSQDCAHMDCPVFADYRTPGAALSQCLHPYIKPTETKLQKIPRKLKDFMSDIIPPYGSSGIMIVRGQQPASASSLVILPHDHKEATLSKPGGPRKVVVSTMGSQTLLVLGSFVKGDDLSSSMIQDYEPLKKAIAAFQDMDESLRTDMTYWDFLGWLEKRRTEDVELGEISASGK